MDHRTTTTQHWKLTALFGILGLLGCLPAMFSPMMFDAPESDSNPATRTLFFSVVSFPIVCFLAVVLSWSGKRALWVFWMPVAVVVLGVIAVCWLQFGYGGRFGG